MGNRWKKLRIKVRPSTDVVFEVYPQQLFEAVAEFVRDAHVDIRKSAGPEFYDLRSARHTAEEWGDILESLASLCDKLAAYVRGNKAGIVEAYVDQIQFMYEGERGRRGE